MIIPSEGIIFKKYPVHVISNSHGWQFSAYPGLHQPLLYDKLFKVYSKGPLLAYNLVENHMEEILELLVPIPKTDYVLMYFGEIDCRVHLPKKALDTNTNVNDLVTECLHRYVIVFDKLMAAGYKKLICCGLGPSTPVLNDRNLVWGSPLERNLIIKIWNRELKKLSSKRLIPYFDIFEECLLPGTFNTNPDMYHDTVHLKPELVFPFLIKKVNDLICKV